MAQREEKEKVNIYHDSFDAARFGEMVMQSDLNESIIAGEKEYKPFPALAEDVFYSLFKYYPMMREEAEIAPESLPNRQLIEKIQEHPHYNYLRAYSKLNEQNSAIGCATLGEMIIQENREQFEDIKKQEQKIKNLQQQMKKQAQAYQEAKQAGNQQAQKTLKQKIKDAMAQQQAAQQQQQQAIASIDVTSALEQTNSSIQAQEEMILTYGNEAGQMQKVDFKTRLEFAKNFLKNKKFNQIMKTLGRFKRLACKKQKEKVKVGMTEISDIILSQQINHMLPSEALNLIDPDLEMIFNKKFIEGQLLTYDLTGLEEKAKGPIICAVDVSGSMSGNNEIWAKGVALALIDIANKENRLTYLMLFDTRLGLTIEFKGKKETDYLTKITEFAEFFTGGGTSFDPVLNKAMQLFNTEQKYKKADLVLISDGCGGLSSDVIENFQLMKAERKINMVNIVIGGDSDSHSAKCLANQSIDVATITDQKAGEIFGAI